MNYLLEGQTTTRLLFRKLNPSDAEIWIAFCRHPLSNKYWHTPAPETPEYRCNTLFESTFERYTKNKGGMQALIHKHSGAFIGQCGLLIQQVDGKEELEVGYAIMPEYWNMGYATEAARKCIDYSFQNAWRDSIISIIHQDNIESQKVAMKNGMAFEKKTIYKGNPVKIFRIRKEDFASGNR